MSFGNGVGGSFTAIEAVLSIVFCSLVLHGLKTSNPKLILPSLVYIPINTTAVMFEIAIMAFVPWFSAITWNNYDYRFAESYYRRELVALVAVCGAVVIVLLALTLAPWIAFYRVYKFFKHGQNAGANVQRGYLEGIDSR